MATKHDEEAEAATAAQAEAEAAAAAAAETETETDTAAEEAAAAAAQAEAEAAAAQAEAAAAESEEETETESEEETETESEDEEGDEEKETSVKAVWTTAYINKLPDSAFAVVLAGGKKDSGGKTVPRSLRKLPHHDAGGKVDEPHLNNALSREPQTNMPAAAHAKAKAHLNKHKGKKDVDPKDFDDDVAADMAADVLVDKMFSGFRIALNSLIKVLVNGEVSLPDRQKLGDEIVEQYQAFVAETWDETIEELGDAGEGKGISDVNLDTHLHDALSEAEGVVCDVAGYETVAAKVAEIGEATKSLIEERDALRKESEQKTQAIAYLEQVLDAMMELPLPTVTTKENGRVAQSLAERFPALDTRVVERMARYAPSTPNRS